MAWGGISHRIKSPLVVVDRDLTAVRYRDEILCPFAVRLVQCSTKTRFFLVDQFRTALLEEGKTIPMGRINALMNSMQRKNMAVTVAQGGHTRYLAPHSQIDLNLGILYTIMKKSPTHVYISMKIMYQNV